MRKRIIMLAILSGILSMITGCGAQKYNVDYHGAKDAFTGAKDSYKAGETVSITLDIVATDTDYTFYVDGEKMSTKPGYGYTLEFTMPDHDIEIEIESRNTMDYMPGSEWEE